MTSHAPMARRTHDGRQGNKGRGVLSPHAPLAPYSQFRRSFKRRGSSATQSRIPQFGACLRKPSNRERAKADSRKHQTETTEVMIHALSSEALRREQAHTRESERVFTELTQ